MISLNTRKLLELRDPLLQLAIRAAARILEIYQDPKHIEIQVKGDNSPVTQADLASQDILAAGLLELTPDIPVISEEGEEADYETTRKHWKQVWLVDPLDGTREFIRHNGEFTINLALVHEGRPVLGLIHVPEHAQAFFAVEGEGAWCDVANQGWEPIRARSWQLGNPVFALASRGPTLARVKEILEAVSEAKVQTMGSALKMCRIAEGEADVYFRLGNTYEWDTAAAQCIVAEAGGQLLGLDWQPLRYNKPQLLNPHFLVMGDKRFLTDYLLKKKLFGE